jgi:hypothetical protein
MTFIPKQQKEALPGFVALLSEVAAHPLVTMIAKIISGLTSETYKIGLTR